MGVDLTKITESEWKILVKTKSLSFGCYTRLAEVISLIKKADVLIKNNQLEIVCHQIIQWIEYRFISMLKSWDDLTSYLIHYRKVDTKLDVWLKRFFEFGLYCWSYDVPKNYRYVDTNWWKDLLYGARAFSFWNNNVLLLGFYGLEHQIQLIDIEDIPDLWKAYQKTYESLLERLNQLWRGAWGWHWVLYKVIDKTIKQIEESYQRTLKNLREKFLKREHSWQVLKLLVDVEFYETIFNKILKSEDRETLKSNWQLYYPNWIIIYETQLRDLDHDALLKQQLLIQSFKDAKESAYRYGRIIEKKLEEEDAIVIGFIESMFHITMEYYDGFWYQFKDWAIFKERKVVLQCLNHHIANWCYQKQALLELPLSKIERSKIALEHYICLVSRYNQNNSAHIIKRYRMLFENLWYQCRINLGYAQLKEAQILWRSIDIVVNLPINSIDYVEKLKACLFTHSCLPKDVGMALQAYMVTLGRYHWLRNWELDVLVELVHECKKIESIIWQQGVCLLEKEVLDQLQKRRKYDL